MVREYRYYTYKVTFKDLPMYFYYGRKKDDGKPYFGSPKTWKGLWDQFEPEIQVLQWYRTEKEAKEAEDALIECTWKQEWGGRRYSLNENKGGLISEDACRRGGRSNSPLQKEARERAKETLFSYSSENGRNSASKITKEQRKTWGSSGGKSKTEKQVRSRKESCSTMRNHPNTKRARSRNLIALNKKRRKPVLCVETGEVFSHSGEVKEKMGINAAHVRECCRGGGRKTAGGYTWEWA